MKNPYITNGWNWGNHHLFRAVWGEQHISAMRGCFKCANPQIPWFVIRVPHKSIIGGTWSTAANPLASICDWITAKSKSSHFAWFSMQCCPAKSKARSHSSADERANATWGTKHWWSVLFAWIEGKKHLHTYQIISVFYDHTYTPTHTHIYIYIYILYRYRYS